MPENTKSNNNVTSLPGTNSALSGGGFVRAVNDWLM